MLVCRGRAGFTISRNLGVARPKEIYHALSFCLIMSSRRDLVISTKLFFRSLGLLFSSFISCVNDHFLSIVLIMSFFLVLFYLFVLAGLCIFSCHFEAEENIYSPLPCKEILYCGGEVGGE